MTSVRSSQLVQMAEEAGRPSRWWVGWLAAVVIIFLPAVAVTPVAGALLGNPESTDPTYQYGELFAFGATLLLLFLWVRFKERRSFATVGFRPGSGWVGLLLGFVVGAAMMTVGVLAGLALGQYGDGLSAHALSGSGAVLALLPLVLVFFLQGTTEESVTRGYMLQVGARQLPGWLAIVGSSVVFAAVHFDFTPLVLTNIFLYAIFACLVALRQGSLWLVGGIHAGWNYFQGNVFGLPVSGSPEATSFFRLGPTAGSSDALSGGTFGLEASLIGTVVLAVATVVAFLAFRRSRRVAPSVPREHSTTSGR